MLGWSVEGTVDTNKEITVLNGNGYWISIGKIDNLVKTTYFLSIIASVNLNTSRLDVFYRSPIYQ